MSLKLLKQSVDIIEEDLKQTKPKKGKQQSSNVIQKNKTLNNRLQQQHYSKNTSKKNIRDIKHELNSTNKKSEQNVRRLLALSVNTVKAKDAEKIVQSAHKGRYVEKKIPKVVQQSIFTEEDFRKFEEEYFNS